MSYYSHLRVFLPCNMSADQNLDTVPRSSDRLESAAYRIRNVTYVSSYRFDAAAIKTLDSNVKKCTTFVKKLGRIGDDNKASILREVLSLNLNR